MDGRKGNQFWYGEFSVGEVQISRDNNNGQVVMVRRVNNEYPHNFWCNLYRLATGKDINPRGCLAKLFGF